MLSSGKLTYGLMLLVFDMSMDFAWKVSHFVCEDA